jgi:L-ectoine synthase
MKIVQVSDLVGTDRDVKCPKGAFSSYRILLEKDNMGFSLHKTVIPVGGPHHWHYKNHLEACYCVEGVGVLTNLSTGEKHVIAPETTYVLDQNDDHTFEALEPVVLISIFNPPVKGGETHREDGSYE